MVSVQSLACAEIRGNQRATVDKRVDTVSVRLCKPYSCTEQPLSDHLSTCLGIMVRLSHIKAQYHHLATLEGIEPLEAAMHGYIRFHNHNHNHNHKPQTTTTSASSARAQAVGCGR